MACNKGVLPYEIRISVYDKSKASSVDLASPFTGNVFHVLACDFSEATKHANGIRQGIMSMDFENCLIVEIKGIINC